MKPDPQMMKEPFSIPFVQRIILFIIKPEKMDSVIQQNHPGMNGNQVYQKGSTCSHSAANKKSLFWNHKETPLLGNNINKHKQLPSFIVHFFY